MESVGYHGLTGRTVVLIIVAVLINGVGLSLLFPIPIFVAVNVVYIIIGLGVRRGWVEDGIESFVCQDSMESIGRAGDPDQTCGEMTRC
jgi:hypothetical protein